MIYRYICIATDDEVFGSQVFFSNSKERCERWVNTIPLTREVIDLVVGQYKFNKFFSPTADRSVSELP